MTPRIILQQKTDTQSQIIAALMSLRDGCGKQNQEIAAALSVQANFLSGVYKGNRNGSKQLLAGLRLLLELENLKKEVIELRAGQAALRKFMGQSEIGGGAKRLNEAGINSTAPERTVPATDRPPAAYVKRQLRKKLPPGGTPPAAT
jgi:hypothetical protein